MLLLAADDFEDTELLYPLYRLREEEIRVTVAGLDEQPVRGKKGHGPLAVDTTVLLLAVARRLGMGAGGYGYLFASMGVGGLIGTGLAGRAARCPRPRYVLAAALAAVGLPLPLLTVIGWPALALTVVAFCGAGAMLIEVMMETCLQRTLDAEVFGRAYGLAIPASLGGILVGSLIAPALSAAVGTSGALVITGCAVIGYAAVVLRRAPGARIATPRPGPAAVASE